MTELALRKHDLPTPGDWATMLSMAGTLVESGLLPKHITTPAAAVAIIQRGIELGVPPMYALNNIVYIQGKATTNSELMLALVYRDHGDGAVLFVETNSNRCAIEYKRRSWSSYQQYQFTLADAKVAGLLSNATWQKYPAAMLRARAISAVARMAFPDSIGGMYTPEELGATVDIDREGHYVIVDENPTTDDFDAIVPDPEDDERSIDAQLRRDIQSAINYANNALTMQHVRQAYKFADSRGLLSDPAVAGAIEAARQVLETDPEQRLAMDQQATHREQQPLDVK